MQYPTIALSLFIPLFAAFAFPSQANAQQLIEELLHRKVLPPDLSGIATVVDIDGDGNEDFVLRDNNRLSAFRSDGHARFTEMAVPPPFGVKIRLGDLDGDGLEDVLDYDNLAGMTAGIYLRRPAAAWLKVPLSTAVIFASLRLADLDGDGDLDAIGAGRDSATKQFRFVILINQGRGIMTDETSRRIAGAVFADPIAVDLDGDGDLDLLGRGLVGSAAHTRTAFTNDGQGKFTIAASFPWNILDVADLDGDGVDDLLVYSPAGRSLTIDVWLGATQRLGTGSGWPTNLTLYPVQSYTQCLDVDGDGDQDILLPGQGGSIVLENLGSLRFKERALIPVGGQDLLALLAIDADGDGDIDLLETRSRTMLLLNDSTGHWQDIMNRASRNPRPRGGSLGLLVDLDGDADLDLVYRGISDSSEQLQINDGTGHFTGRPFEQGSSKFGISPRIMGDVDGDGDADAVLLDQGFKYHLRLNQGNNFPGPGTVLPGLYGDMRFVDIDSDGDLDILSGVLTTGAWDGGMILLNTPTGFVNQGRWRLGAATNQKILAVGDIDGDRDLDLICEESAQRWVLYANNGAGVFSPAGSMTLQAAFSSPSVLADLDGDGDLDLLVANGKTTDTWRNDGSGGFTIFATYASPDFNRRPLLLDLDADGDLDAINTAINQMVIQINQGDGTFLPASPGSGPKIPPLFITGIGDIDGDGDDDLVQTFGSLHVFSNLTRQLSTTSAVLSGADYSYEIHAQGSQPISALPLIAFGELPRPVDLPVFGRFWLDPALTFTLPTVAIGPMGVAETRLIKVPSTPALFGAVISAQAVIMPSQNTLTWRLTNLVRETVLR